MKEWLTARELAAEQLPDMPATESAIIRMAERDGWNSTSCARKRPGLGGATEYHFSLLPTLAQVTYTQRHMVIELPVEPAPARPEPDISLSAKAGQERDARLVIVDAFQKFSKGLQASYALRVQVFVDKFNQGSINVAPFVREIVPSLSKRSLARWQATAKEGKANALGHDPAAARKGKGVLEMANGGKVRAFILGLIAHQPHLSAHHVRTLCRSEFGDRLNAVSKGIETVVDMPPVRTFQHALKGLKQTHRVELMKLTNPDRYRSTMAPAGVGMLRDVTEANQLWQIDASPVDALCLDGRHAVYACVDIATRRTIFFVSRTPRASAVALLIRKAILAWGVPDRVKTDNGSDFVARDTQRLFASLGVEVELSDPYQPQQKGHVERAIGTFQRDVGPLLPGFIGHSVADRKAIESRKSFAQRLGESDAETFGVQLTGVKLQEHIDEWALLAYQHRPHAGLKAETPFKTALASVRPIRRVDQRALDLLLMPAAGGDGRRVVTKTGVRIEGNHYMTPTVLPGTNVFVRMDPNDLGRAYVFAEDGASFLGEAMCPELAGINPVVYVREAKALQREILAEGTKQISAEAKRIAKGPMLIERVLDVARRDAPNVVSLPKREETHTTPQISAAIEAMGERLNPSRELTPREAAEHRRMIAEMRENDESRLIDEMEALLEQRRADVEEAMTAHLPKGENVVALPETPKDRYRRALLFAERMKAGALSVKDGEWLANYVKLPEFQAHKQLHEDFGDTFLS